MRLLDYFGALLALAALPFVAWWGIYQSPQSAANLEARLETTARAALAKGGFTWANVDFDGQRAILWGPAPSRDAIEEAARAIRRATGGGGLILGGVTLVESRADAAAPISPYEWRASRDAEGIFILTGFVPSRGIQAELAAAIARTTGTAPDDRTEVAAGAPRGNWQGVAMFGLEQLTRLDQGELRIVDHDVLLRGRLSDDAVRRDVRAAINGIAAPFSGRALIHGLPVFEAAIKGGVMRLAGRVSTTMEIATIEALARRNYSGEIRNEIAVGGPSSMDWVDLAVRGLPNFGRFHEGLMVIDPKINGVTFEGEAPPSALTFLAEDFRDEIDAGRAVIAATSRLPDVPELAAIDFVSDPRAACEAAFDLVMSGGVAPFGSGRADLSRESAETLDKLAAVAVRCHPSLLVKVEGRSDGARDTSATRAIAATRAEVLARHLALSGAGRERIAAIGYEAVVPGQDIDPEGAASRGRPVVFRVVERGDR